MRRILPLAALTLIIFSTSAIAQIEIGASFELRNEDPESGFGLRIQKGFFEILPMVDVGLRAHFSYFREENQVDDSGGFSYSEDLTNYDFGIAAYGGVSLGLMEPYIGLGLGSETTDINVDYPLGAGPGPEEGEESNIYWNTFVGAKVTIIPLVKPFVEYRYSNKELGEPTLADAQNGRIMFGVNLSF
ncbi:MAG: porin family protein [Balneolaceae bacterium]